MKRFWHDQHFRLVSRKLASKSQARNLRFKDEARRRRRLEQGISKASLKVFGEFKHLPVQARFLTAPTEMCFVKNPEEMAAFIGKLKAGLEARAPVFVNIQDVEVMELNAITVLLAVMVQFKSRGIKFSGNMPIRDDVRRILEESLFFEHLSGHYRQKESYDLVGSSIYTHGKLSVDSEFSQKLIDAAAKTIWGQERRCPGVQRTLIELMQNTHNHASLSKSGEKHWWISLQHLKNEHKVIFCFVDFGVGVFESLANKPESSLLHNVIELFKRLFGVSENEQILKLIFDGELHKTVTGKYFRGKGLPGIYGVLKKNRISKLSMITNDVYFTAEGEEFRRLRQEFSGTFISWELSRQNESLPNET